MAEPDRVGSRLPIEDAAREQLMVRIARMAFLEDATQTEIARATGLNRWQVSRLLAEARDTGIVQIRIVPKSGRMPDLEYALQQRFGLSDVIVCADEAGVAPAAGQYIGVLTPAPARLGVSWGRTMGAVAQAVPMGWANGVEVVQINGTVPPIPQEKHHNDVASTIAEKGAGQFVPLPVPAIVGAAETRQVLEQDRIVRNVIERARGADCLMFSMGALGESALLESGNIEPDEHAVLVSAGAVGDILGRFVDVRGQVVDRALDARTIGLEFDDLRRAERTIAVASGNEKQKIVLAALRAGVVKTLITDAGIAAYVLEHENDD